MSVWADIANIVGSLAAVGATFFAFWSCRIAINAYNDEKKQRNIRKKQDWFNNIFAKRILSELDIIIESYLNGIQNVRLVINTQAKSPSFEEDIKNIYDDLKYKTESLKIATYTSKIVNYKLYMNLSKEIEHLEDEFSSVVNIAVEKHYISQQRPEDEIKKFASNIIKKVYEYDVNENCN